jgi:hypothetical protein
MLLHAETSGEPKFIQGGSFVKFDKSHKKIALSIFLEFQKKAEVGYWSNIAKGQNQEFYSRFLVQEFNQMLKKFPIKYTMLDHNDNPFGFMFFTKNILAERSLDLQFGFKRSDYFLNSEMIKIFKNILENARLEHNIDNVYACLMERKNQEKYNKTVLNVLGAKIINKDAFGRPLIKFE